MSAPQLVVDLGKYGAGLGVGHEKVTVLCPKCGRGAFCKRFKASTRYVHRGLIENGPEGLTFTQLGWCVVRERNDLGEEDHP